LELLELPESQAVAKKTSADSTAAIKKEWIVIDFMKIFS
jgi:hypothetical protein